MTARMAAVVSIVVLEGFVVGAAQSPTLRAPKARIEGRIFRADTEEPVSGIRIILTRTSEGAVVPAGLVSASFSSTATSPTPLGPAVSPTGITPGPSPIPFVVTNREGRFVIEGLDSGSYKLVVVGGGFVRQEYGQRAFPGQGTPITLAEGQELRDIVMRLTPTGTLTGRLRDASGYAAVGVPVNLLRVSYSATGERRLSSTGVTRTNDRGEYRLYWVTPGRYLLAAGNPPGPSGGYPGGQQATSPNEAGDLHVLTYFPGVTDATQAASIAIQAGSEQVADFPLDRQQLVSVKGRVIDGTTGRPPNSLVASLSFSSLTTVAGLSYNPRYNPTTGAFELPAVVPGSYSLQLTSDQLVGRTPLDVRQNIDGLQVVLTPTVVVSGAVSIVGLRPPRLRVQLTPASSALGFPIPSALIGSDGTFRLERVPPGDYRLAVSERDLTNANGDVGSEFFVEAAMFAGKDVLNQGLTISDRNDPEARLQIRLSRDVAEIEGMVVDEQARPTAGATVVLIPARRDRAELYVATASDQNGRYRLRGITPGEYKLFSWETLEQFGYFDRDLLTSAEHLGSAVRLEQSSTRRIDLRAIRSSQ